MATNEALRDLQRHLEALLERVSRLVSSGAHDSPRRRFALRSIVQEALDRLDGALDVGSFCALPLDSRDSLDQALVAASRSARVELGRLETRLGKNGEATEAYIQGKIAGALDLVLTALEQLEGDDDDEWREPTADDEPLEAAPNVSHRYSIQGERRIEVVSLTAAPDIQVARGVDLDVSDTPAPPRELRIDEPSASDSAHEESPALQLANDASTEGDTFETSTDLESSQRVTAMLGDTAFAPTLGHDPPTPDLVEASRFARGTSAPLGAGSTVGDFQILAPIGKGGMGTVFLARRVSLADVDRFVALKVIHRHLADNPEAIVMMVDEATAASHVHHPNLVSVESLEQYRGHLFLVMQYIAGCNFNNLLKIPQVGHLEAVLQIVLDALEGLHAAHQTRDHLGKRLHLVHRDFTPSNILVGLDGFARVADFGIAKTVSTRARTRDGIVKGKAAYLSPEQLRGRDVDQRSDLFAAGIVLFNGLTGCQLFASTSDGATTLNILEMEIPAPSDVSDHVSPHFDRVVLRALDRDPARRFQTAAEMAEALREAAWKAGVQPKRRGISEWVRQRYGAELEARDSRVREILSKKRLEHERDRESAIASSFPAWIDEHQTPFR